MKYKQRRFLVIIVVSIIILLSCACLSRYVAYRKVCMGLKESQKVIGFRLSRSWPFHWHVVIEEQAQEFPNYFLKPAETNEYLKCISLTGKRLLIWPKGKIEERTMIELSDPRMRMRCVYHKGKDWAVLTESDAKKIMEEAKDARK